MRHVGKRQTAGGRVLRRQQLGHAGFRLLYYLAMILVATVMVGVLHLASRLE